jgi:hypothetical protein
VSLRGRDSPRTYRHADRHTSTRDRCTSSIVAGGSRAGIGDALGYFVAISRRGAEKEGTATSSGVQRATDCRKAAGLGARHECE